MKKLTVLLVLLFLTFSNSAYAANTPTNTTKKPITEGMILKRNSTLTLMENNHKVAIDNLENLYKNLLGAQKDPKYLKSTDSMIGINKINKTYLYYKDKINQAYENDKRFIIQYYGE
jgi:hypothetical protein